MSFRIRIKANILDIKNICLYMFFVLTAIIFLYQYSSTMFNLRYGFMIIGALFGFVACIRLKVKFYQPILLLFVLFLCWSFCFLGQGEYLNYSFSDFMYTALYIGMSVVLLKNEYNHNLSLAIYIFTALTILVKIFQNVNMNHILLANSRNYISVLLLLSLMFYYISCHDKNKSIFVFPAILYFYISIYAVGRGGIVSSGVLVIALSVYKAASIKNKNVRRLMWLIIFIVVITIVFYVGNLDTSVIKRFLNDNFSRFILKGTTDTARESIWSTFFKNNKESIQNFLLGSNATLVGYDGNLHNSFLQTYASFGLFGFLTIVFLLIRAIVQGVKNKDILFLILLLELSLRAFTDRVFFQGYCEIFLYYFILYWDYKKNIFDNQIISNMTYVHNTKPDIRIIRGVS